MNKYISDCLASVTHCYGRRERAFLIPASPLSTGRGITFISSENGVMINPSNEIQSNSICCVISWNSVLAKTALPGGYRFIDGDYLDMGDYANFWSATESGSYTAWGRKLYYNLSEVNRANEGKRYSFSVRLLKD